MAIHTQPDIVLEIFRFLSRDNLEKIQIVGKSWSKLIANHINTLPLRLYNSLSIDEGDVVVYYNDIDKFFSKDVERDGTGKVDLKEEIKPELMHLLMDPMKDICIGLIDGSGEYFPDVERIRALKTCVFEKLVYETFDKEVASLFARTKRICGEKIRVIDAGTVKMTDLRNFLTATKNGLGIFNLVLT